MSEMEDNNSCSCRDCLIYVVCVCTAAGMCLSSPYVTKTISIPGGILFVLAGSTSAVLSVVWLKLADKNGIHVDLSKVALALVLYLLAAITICTRVCLYLPKGSPEPFNGAGLTFGFVGAFVIIIMLPSLCYGISYGLIWCCKQRVEYGQIFKQRLSRVSKEMRNSMARRRRKVKTTANATFCKRIKSLLSTSVTKNKHIVNTPSLDSPPTYEMTTPAKPAFSIRPWIDAIHPFSTVETSADVHGIMISPDVGHHVSIYPGGPAVPDIDVQSVTISVTCDSGGLPYYCSLEKHKQ